MSAVVRAARGGLGGRKLQAVIVGLVVLAATAASTLALGMLVDAHSPFDHAFAAQRGADVVAAVDTAVASPAQVSAAEKISGVTAVTGPLPSEGVTAQVSLPGSVLGSVTTSLNLVGRSSPGGKVDDLVLQSGHWARNDSQIVLSAASSVGQIGSTVTVGTQVMNVVGVADSVTNTADGWVLPTEMNAIAGPGGTGQAQLLYRFSSSATSSDITADIGAVRAALPRGAVLGTASYLAARQSEQSGVAPWVPFIIAFGVIAIVISVLIVVNVVSGAVIAGTTRIGVLKSVGFTPLQVVTCYVLLVAVPAISGAVVGVICGNLLAAPIYQQNAQVYQVGALGVPFWVDLAVPLAVLALTVTAAAGPASRAGAMSPVQAITTGRAPKARHGFLAQRVLARLAIVPRPVTLGFAAPAARPGRTLITVLAVLLGATAVTFGVGLGTSLNRTYNDISRVHAVPVAVTALPPGVTVTPSGPAAAAPGLGGGKPSAGGKPGSGGKGVRIVLGGAGGGPRLTAAQRHAITTAIGSQPGTLHYLSQGGATLSLTGLTSADGGAHVIDYGDGNPAWSGLVLISGSWYSASSAVPEIDVNTLFLTDTGLAVGDTYTMVNGQHSVTTKIAGEVFDPGDNVDVFMAPATLASVDPAASSVSVYQVAVRPGVTADAYASGLNTALGDNYVVSTARGGATELAAITVLVTMLTLLIIIVAGLGVLNTVALQIRERAHDIGVFKALGMTPRQTLTMVICSIGITGLFAGIVAVPVGIILHHQVVPAMAHAANSGYPPSLISVYSVPELIILALAGLVIAIAGALIPASWAANSRTVTALRTE
jgi:putative ABC transport system permease protein